MLVYSQPYKSVSLTLNEPGRYPLDVAVSKAGLVGVMTETSPSGPGNVTFYKKGSTSACANVSDANWNEVLSGAFDASGNLFVDGVDRDGNPLVGEVSGGCAATSLTTLSVGNTMSGVAGVQVVHGNILILNENYGYVQLRKSIPTRRHRAVRSARRSRRQSCRPELKWRVSR